MAISLKCPSIRPNRITLRLVCQPRPDEKESFGGSRGSIEFIGALAGADPKGTPANIPVSNGKSPKRPGKTYSPEIGKVLLKVQGDSASYRFNGKELDVRAVVRSNKPISNPPGGDVQKEEAWCQPMGWWLVGVAASPHDSQQWGRHSCLPEVLNDSRQTRMSAPL
jgi:hypothetical protein